MEQEKDIGILTWHYYTNVGSNLQAYALYRVIKDLGYSCEFINYRKGETVSFLRKICKDLCSAIDSHMQGVVPPRLRVQAYRFQRNYYEQSPLLQKGELSDYCKRYKILLCGSDQIWAPNVLDLTYLLDFTDAADVPKYSYASSIGLPVIPKDLVDTYRTYLSKFSLITVRERQGTEILAPILGHKVDWVLDPTFLLNEQEWRKVSRPYQLPSQPFLFCYLLGNTSEYRDWIDEMARENGLDVLCMSDQKIEKRSHWTYLKYVGPREFLGYLDNAVFVVTDSFHGMALSINLNKDFYVLERFKASDRYCQNSRIVNILEAFSIENRLLKGPCSSLSKVDWSLVNNRVSAEKQRSMEILESMLQQGCKE